MNKIIEEMVTINTYGIIEELDINNMTEKSEKMKILMSYCSK